MSGQHQPLVVPLRDVYYFGARSNGQHALHLIDSDGKLAKLRLLANEPDRESRGTKTWACVLPEYPMPTNQTSGNRRSIAERNQTLSAVSGSLPRHLYRRRPSSPTESSYGRCPPSGTNDVKILIAASGDKMTGSRRPTDLQAYGSGWRIDDVRARSDLAALLDDLAQPAMYATRGRRWHCPVPDHDDHHASVTIHTDHRGHERWRCWSGDNHHRGDAIDLVTLTQRTTRPEALDWLAQRAGMIPDLPFPAIAARKPTSSRVDTPLDPAVVRYVGACEKILWRPAGQPVREWLNGRGFSDELLRANHVGADPGRQMMQRQRGLPFGAALVLCSPRSSRGPTVMPSRCGANSFSESQATARRSQDPWRHSSEQTTGSDFCCTSYC